MVRKSSRLVEMTREGSVDAGEKGASSWFSLRCQGREIRRNQQKRPGRGSWGGGRTRGARSLGG